MSKNPFEYHAPTEAQVEAMKRTRGGFKAAYDDILAVAPASAERTLAIRKLEEASMWANKAIVFDGECYPS